jgi:Sulfatase
MGLMGYRTPNIDRIAKEGMLFTDSYGEQSCTAGRSSFITGQSVYRTGLSKVGMPGVDMGMNPKDPTQFLDTFKEFPPRHPPASFLIEHAVEELHEFLEKMGG